MSAYLADTSCLVALVCAWHVEHETTRKDMERRQRRGETLCVSAHGLLETYSVLTRLPAPYRFSSADAFAVIEANFSELPAVSLDALDYWGLLRELRQRDVTGGQSYDAIAAACAREAGCSALLTWNTRHFQPFQGTDLAIESPAAA